jgi:curli biogenesis system outer membrane secretion channel CsgG
MPALHRCLLGTIVAVCLIPLTHPSCVEAQGGGLRYTIAVTDFTNQSGWRGQGDLGHDLGIVLTSQLEESGRFIVLGESSMRKSALEEQDVVASGRAAGGSKGPATGHLTPAQLLIRGAITHVQNQTASDDAGFRIGDVELGGRSGATEINVTFEMVDASTGQVVAARSVVGTARNRGLRIRVRRNGTETNLGRERDDNLQSALAAAAQQAIEWMVGRLASVPWQGKVAGIDGQTIYINRGSREGMSPGKELVVGLLEVMRDPDTGEVLGQFLKKEVARLEVEVVQEKLSTCRLLSGDARAVRQGLTVILPTSR